jgi:hypothetical protein
MAEATHESLKAGSAHMQKSVGRRAQVEKVGREGRVYTTVVPSGVSAS